MQTIQHPDTYSQCRVQKPAAEPTNVVKQANGADLANDQQGFYNSKYISPMLAGTLLVR